MGTNNLIEKLFKKKELNLIQKKNILNNLEMNYFTSFNNLKNNQKNQLRMLYLLLY